MPALILIADDDPDILDLISALLTQEGFQTVACSNGLAALQHILAQRPALAIVDLAMPLMTGSELIQQIRNEPGPPLPIILMSASTYIPPHDLRQADAYLAKPFDLEELLEQVIFFTSGAGAPVALNGSGPTRLLVSQPSSSEIP